MGPTGAVRGVLALALLLALVVGIPVVLLVVGSTSHVAELGDVPRLLGNLTAPDDGTLFLGVLALAAWIGWATFTVAVVLEVPAQFRGVPAVRFRGMGLQQSLAGGLVAAALALVVIPGSAGAVESSVGRPVVATSSVAPSPPVVAPGPPAARAVQGATNRQAGDEVTDVGAARPTYEVRRGDTLWDIAGEHLGDGSQWRRIAELNYDVAQPDGGHLDRSHVLRPGWRLVLPGPPERAHEGRGHRHLVQAGETLSGIAREELGSADRWPEIVEASASTVQPGGERLSNPDRIYPGWTVRVPADRDADDAGSRSVSPAPPTNDEAASARRSEDAVQGNGLDPSWSYREEPTSAVTTPPLAGQSGRASVSADPGTPSPAAPPSQGSSDDAAEAATDDAPDVGDVGDVRTVGGVGALLAACLVMFLGARRARQQRRRRPGERIPLPPPSVSTTEARLRAVADVAGVSHVDLALRALASEQRAEDRPLPGLRTARLTRTHLELYLTEAARLPAPWTPTSDPTVWAMSSEDLTSQVDTDIRAPYPALVTVGHDLEDAHVLLDLEQAPALAVDGEPHETLPVLAAIAVELATSPWADDLLVTLVGCLPELPGTVATGRLRHVDRIEQLIADLEGRAADVERVLLDAGAPDLVTARGTGVADDAWPPEIVILTADVPGPLRERLERLLHRVPRVGIAAVTTGSALGEWRLRVESGELARLDPTGVTLRPQRLVGSEYDHVLELVATADAAPVDGPAWASGLPGLEQALADLPAPDLAMDAANGDADSTGVDSGDADGTGVDIAVVDSGDVDNVNVNGADVADGTDGGEVVPLPGRAPYVRLLGTVEVVGATGPEPVALKDGRAVASHLARATALVAYLACRSEGATTEQVSEALSPVRRLTPSTVWSLASRTRKWLGSDPDGIPYFPRTADAGAHLLHPAVRTDWADWLGLVGNDVTTTALPRLLEALALVRGRPFDGVSERHYVWAEPLRQEMVAGIVDVAHDVVRRALLIPDGVAARKALRAGRLVDPTNELLWRDALRIEYVAGSPESRKRLIEQLYAAADDLETDLEPETEELIAELERGKALRAAAR